MTILLCPELAPESIPKFGAAYPTNVPLVSTVMVRSQINVPAVVVVPVTLFVTACASKLAASLPAASWTAFASSFAVGSS